MIVVNNLQIVYYFNRNCKLKRIKLRKSKAELDNEHQKKLIKSGAIPNHIAIIMDGNGRWARSKGLPRFAGHKVGIDSVRDIVEACAQIGVKYLTLYTFSTENWKRPREEVTTLMRLLLRTIKKETSELNKNDVKLTAIGNIDSLPIQVQNELQEAIEKTKNNSKLTLILALSYSGRWEIINAIKNFYSDVKNNLVSINDFCEADFEKYLTTKNIPDPDLLIRTSGEFRVSNFLLWQIAYAEIFISSVFWPVFRREQLYEAISDFQKRERRFGKVSEQIKKP